MNTQNDLTNLISNGNDLATLFNRSLLKKYLFDANISACPNCSEKPFVYASLSSSENCGFIAFSPQAVTALVGMSLSASETDTPPQSPTPTTLKILHNIAQTICLSVDNAICGEFSTTSPQDFNIFSAFHFLIDNQHSFWLQLPAQKTSKIAENMPCELTAVIQQTTLPLTQLSNWKIGSFLPLGIEKNAEISILQGNTPKFMGIMGQKSRHIAVKITQKV